LVNMELGAMVTSEFQQRETKKMIVEVNIQGQSIKLLS
jgi:hypothetical protein